MAKPVILYPWDSGGLNLVAPTGTHQTNGFVSSEIPTSGEANALAQNTWLWLSWLIANVATVTRNRFPIPLGTPTGWAYSTGGGLIVPAYQTNAAATLTADLDVPQGYKLSQLKFGLASASASPGGNFTATITAISHTGAGTSTVATYTVANGSLPTSQAAQTLNLLTSSTGLTVTVAAAGGTYTRSAGSFITDGNFVGQVVQWAGFVNGGNNGLKTITALTATVMTVSTTGLVNETGSAGGQSVTGVSPTVDDTISLQITFAQSASGGSAVSFGPLRTTIVPQ